MAQTDEFVLVVTHDGEEQHYLLEREESIVLGRSKADIVLPDDGQLISRCHATLEWRENVYWIRDRSRNGTALGNVMLTPDIAVVWIPGQIVTIGQYQLRLQSAGEFALVQLEVKPAQAEIECGDKQRFELLLTNNGELVSDFAFRLDGVDPSWAALSRTSVQVMPGQTGDAVHLTVQPPLASSSYAGDYLLRIGVINQYDQLVATRQVRLTVLPFYDHAITVRPQQAKANKPIRLRIHNRGNQETGYQVALSDAQEALRFEPDHFDMRVAPGAVAEKRFLATELQRRWIGPQIDHDVNVIITPEQSKQDETQAINVAASGCLSPLAASILSALITLAIVAAIMILQPGDRTPPNVIAMETKNAAQLTATSIAATATWRAEDSDGDGLVNKEELEHNTDAANRDSDGDGLPDGDEVLIWGTKPSGPASQDSDGDGMLDGEDAQKCDPTDSDTDDDGRLDGDPLEFGCKNPDFDGDKIRDGDDIDPGKAFVPPPPTPTATETPTMTPSPTPMPTPSPTPTPGPSVVTSVSPGIDARDGCVDISWLITGVTAVRLSVGGAAAEGVAGDNGGSFVRWERSACFASNAAVVWEVEFAKEPPLLCKWEVKISDGEEDVVAPTNQMCTTPRR